MKPEQQTILLKKITHTLMGTYDFQELARNSVDLLVKELKDQDLVGAGIFRVHEQSNILYAYAYSTRYRKTIDKLLPRSFSDLNISLTNTQNLTVRTVVSNSIQQSKKISDFSKRVLPDEITDKVQKVMKGRLAVSFPIHKRSGKVAGVLLLILKEEKLSGEQLELFETFAKQIGIAFSNVLAFEKLMRKFKKAQELKETNISDLDIPSVKFTLRITPRQNRELEKVSARKGKSKAELIRGLIGEYLEKFGH